MTNEEKAREIASMTWGDFEESKKQSLNISKYIQDACLDMAAWKEQQMIKEAVYWIGKNCIKYNELVYLEDNNNVPTHIFHLANFIEDFKKYMEEN